MAKNTADESQVKQAAEKEKRGRERDMLDLKTLLEMPEGRRLFKRLFAVCGVSGSGFRQCERQEAYVLGAKDVGHLFIEDVLEANPGVGAALLAEAYREQGKDKEA